MSFYFFHWLVDYILEGFPIQQPIGRWQWCTIPKRSQDFSKNKQFVLELGLLKQPFHHNVCMFLATILCVSWFCSSPPLCWKPCGDDRQGIDSWATWLWPLKLRAGSGVEQVEISPFQCRQGGHITKPSLIGLSENRVPLNIMVNSPIYVFREAQMYQLQ